MKNITVFLIVVLSAFMAHAGTTNVRIYHQSVASPASVQNKQIGVNSSADANLGFKMWFGKDADGNVTQFLAKDKNARVLALRSDTSYTNIDTAKQYRAPLAKFDSTKSTAARITRAYLDSIRSCDTAYFTALRTSRAYCSTLTLTKISSFDTIKSGSATASAQIDSINGLRLNGTATVWDDLRVIPGSFDRAGTTTDPTLVAYGSTFLWEFEKNDSATFTVQMPHNYAHGESIYAHVHWTPGTRGNEEGTALVGWKVGYSWATVDSVFPAYTVTDLSDACKSTDGQHLMTQEVEMTATGKFKSSMLLCTIKRTDGGAEDTWVGTATGNLPFLLEVDFHYPINSLGTPDRTLP